MLSNLRYSRLMILSSSILPDLEEPDESESNFGRMAYWDESYGRGKDELDTDSESQETSEATDTSNVFSWYCGWTDELGPFFEELVPDKDAMVLVPGIGNDAAIRDMFDVGGYHALQAFDYAPQGVEAAKAIFGPDRLETIARKVASINSGEDNSQAELAAAAAAATTTITKEVFRVCDARDLSGEYSDNTFDAVLEKGTLDSIYLSGGRNKAKALKNLGLAVSELKRVVKNGGIVLSVTAVCTKAINEAFGKDDDWETIWDGSFRVTEEGYASNNVDATMLAWKLATKE